MISDRMLKNAGERRGGAGEWPQRFRTSRAL